MGLYIRIAQNKFSEWITGKDCSKTIARLKNRISHIQAEDVELEMKRQFPKELITTARNIISMDFFHQAENKGVSIPLAETKTENLDLRSITEKMSDGFCLGANLEFARKIFNNQ